MFHTKSFPPRRANTSSALVSQTAEERREAFTRAASHHGGSVGQTASRELNLAVILIFTTTTFFVLHTPRHADRYSSKLSHTFCIFRVISGFYEAIFIRPSLECLKKSKEYFHPLTYMSLNAVIIFLQV